MDIMIPDLLRDCDVGLLLVRRTSTHLDVVDANRAAASLLGAGVHDVRGLVRPSIDVGRVVRLTEAVELAFAGQTSRWCILLELDGGCSRHLNVRVSPYGGEVCGLALVQVSDMPRRHNGCAAVVAVQRGPSAAPSGSTTPGSQIRTLVPTP